MINVDELMGDPDFFVTLIKQRPTTTVGADGLAVSTTSTTNFLGSVSPSGAGVSFTESSQRQSDAILVITAEDLTAGDNAGLAADFVVYSGLRYIVKSVNDYKSWGEGFVAATCEVV